MNSLRHAVNDDHMKHTNTQCAQKADFDFKGSLSIFVTVLNRGKLKIDGKCRCNITF